MIARIKHALGISHHKCSCPICAGTSKYSAPLPPGRYPADHTLARGLRRIDATARKIAPSIGMKPSDLPVRGTVEGDTSYFRHKEKDLYYSEDAIRYAVQTDQMELLDWLAVHENTHAGQERKGKWMKLHFLREPEACKNADRYVLKGEVPGIPKTPIGTLMTRFGHSSTMSKPVARRLGLSTASVPVAGASAFSIRRSLSCGTCTGRHVDHFDIDDVKEL